MAVRLQFLSVVVRRSVFAGCRNLPEEFHQLPSAGGFFFDTTWFDAHLWCETAMDGQAAEDILRIWEGRGLRRQTEPGGASDLCLAASGRGPLVPCPWLAYSPELNSVWLAGSEAGEAIGGHAHQFALEQELAQAESRGEAAYDRMYDARHPKEAYEDACQALGQAQSVAQFLNRQEDAARLGDRLAHIRSVYQAQFRGC
jgi:hypothetical protein